MLKILPGLAVAFAGAGVSWGIAALLAPLLPGVSALLVAILAGVLWRNIAPVPWSLNPGFAIAAKPVLRLGIVLLGFQLSLADRKSTRLNSSHVAISYAVFCLKKKKN